MKTIRKIIQIDEEKCDGCGNCIIGCAEGALAIMDGKARVLRDNLCDGLGACIGECPRGALKIVERQAEPFDEAAVAAHLKNLESTAPAKPDLACGCSSNLVQTITPIAPIDCSVEKPSEGTSALSNWPVQIHLVPTDAPFLKNADLLVAADCVPVAFPTFHRDFLQGRVVMLGCPKLDNAQAYVDKLAAIFRTADIKGVTVVVMEVPCCEGLPRIVEKALSMADVTIPFKQVVVNPRGRIIRERNSSPA